MLGEKNTKITFFLTWFDDKSSSNSLIPSFNKYFSAYYIPIPFLQIQNTARIQKEQKDDFYGPKTTK